MVVEMKLSIDRKGLAEEVDVEDEAEAEEEARRRLGFWYEERLKELGDDYIR
jgi:hypothetical protein